MRVFADNNRTECIHCGKKIKHPSYSCRQKPTFQKRCFHCNDTRHIARDCPYNPICSYCKKGGHKKHDCDLYKVEQARRDYGNYAPEIIKGKRFQERDAQEQTDMYEKNDNSSVHIGVEGAKKIKNKMSEFFSGSE